MIAMQPRVVDKTSDGSAIVTETVSLTVSGDIACSRQCSNVKSTRSSLESGSINLLEKTRATVFKIGKLN